MKFTFTLIVSLLVSAVTFADNITLRVPVTSESPESANYYHELLVKSLEADGHTVTLKKSTFPQARVVPTLEGDAIDLVWLVESADRNSKYVPVEIGISNSLIGKRVLLIKKSDQAKYDGVKTLDDFRALGLTAGMGKGWFDTKVWAANSLGYKEQEGNWRSIYPMVAAGRTYDYFPRGMNEIVSEALQYSDLAIEKNLVLQYDRDYRFYLSKSGSKYKEVIESALVKARDSGLMDELVKKYWASDFEALSFDSRTIIKLTTPM